MASSPLLSPLGFGCASVMGKVGRKASLNAMSAALDLGVTHFDIARSYGFGSAESVLGEFVSVRRDRVTVTSKFGVVPPEFGVRERFLVPIARRVAGVVPQLRSTLKRKSGMLLSERRFDKGYAEICLHRSLRELRTDYLDFYLLHEPLIGDLRGCEEVVLFLERVKSEGKIRRWGVAYRHPNDHAWVSSLGGDVMQFEGNSDTLGSCLPIEDKRAIRFVTRPFSGGGKFDHLTELIRRAGGADVLDEVGASLADFSICLAKALAGPEGTVICGMYSIDHVRANVRAANVFFGCPQLVQLVSKVVQLEMVGKGF